MPQRPRFAMSRCDVVFDRVVSLPSPSLLSFFTRSKCIAPTTIRFSRTARCPAPVRLAPTSHPGTQSRPRTCRRRRSPPTTIPRNAVLATTKGWPGAIRRHWVAQRRARQNSINGIPYSLVRSQDSKSLSDTTGHTLKIETVCRLLHNRRRYVSALGGARDRTRAIAAAVVFVPAPIGTPRSLPARNFRPS